MENWESWFQGVASKWAGSAIDDRYNNQFTLQKMQLQALGPFGQLYNEGSPAMPGQTTVQGTIPTSWLLIGGIIALVMLSGD